MSKSFKLVHSTKIIVLDIERDADGNWFTFEIANHWKDITADQIDNEVERHVGSVCDWNYEPIKRLVAVS